MKNPKKRIVLLVSALMLALTACKKDKDIPSDPRMAFVGEYQSNEEHSMYFARRDEFGTIDSTFTIPAGIKLMVSLAENDDSLIVNVEEVVDDAVSALLRETGAPVSVESAEKTPATLSETNEFEFEDWPIKISYGGLPHEGHTSGKGKIDNNRLFLEYEIVLIIAGTPTSPDDTGNFYGEIVFEKQ